MACRQPTLVTKCAPSPFQRLHTIYQNSTTTDQLRMYIKLFEFLAMDDPLSKDIASNAVHAILEVSVQTNLLIYTQLYVDMFNFFRL